MANGTPYSYVVHGLRVVSDLALPELIEAPAGEASPDVRIELGRAPSWLPGGRFTADGYEVAGNDILLEVPGVVRLHAQAGRLLTVEPLSAGSAGESLLYVLGSGLAAILHQRGTFPLHASAFERDGTCVGFMGDSRAGKSTLAAMMSRRGYRLLSDDILVVDLDPARGPLALPSVPILKLWPQSLAIAALSPEATAAETAYDSKRRIDARRGFSDAPVPLGALFMLRWLHPATAEAEIESMSAFDAMLALRRHVYRPSLIEVLGHEEAFLAFSARLLAGVRVATFSRALNMATADRQVDLLIGCLADRPTVALSPLGTNPSS